MTTNIANLLYYGEKMVRVDENRLIGNFGSSYVAAKLSSDCLVRPVAADTDIGIDLYCETVEEGEPYLHFWMQVKAGKQCREQKDGSYATCDFKVKHLRYWKNQPVPVFAALVPIDWPVRLDPTVYIVDLTSYLVKNELPNTNEASLYSDLVWKPNDLEAVGKFLKDVVPITTARLQCMRGIVTHIPQLRSEYVRQYPEMPIARHTNTIIQQIRQTAAMAIILLYLSGTLDSKNSMNRKLLASVIKLFEHDKHWENFMAPALSHHADGEFSEAKHWYLRARSCILGDPKVNNDPSWQHMVAEIESLIDKTEKLESL